MADYYVNAATGNDANTTAQAASPATPWATCVGAEAKASTGDTVHVAAGTYVENDGTNHCLTVAKGIAWIADGAVIIQAYSGTKVLRLSGSAIISFTDFVFDGNVQTGLTQIVSMAAGTDALTFTNCTFKSPVQSGTTYCVVCVASGTIGFVFTNCTFGLAGQTVSYPFRTQGSPTTLTDCNFAGTCTQVIMTDSNSALTVTGGTWATTGAGINHTGGGACTLSGITANFATGSGYFAKWVTAAKNGAVTVMNNIVTYAGTCNANILDVSAGAHAVILTGNRIKCNSAAYNKVAINVNDQLQPLVTDNYIDLIGSTALCDGIMLKSINGVDMGACLVKRNTILIDGLVAGHAIQVGLDGTAVGNANENKNNGSIIESNVIYGPVYWTRAVGVEVLHGILLGYSTGTVRYNRVYGAGIGIGIKGSNQDFAHANAVYHNVVTDASIMALVNKGQKNCDFYNNTVYYSPGIVPGEGCLRIGKNESEDTNTYNCDGTVFKNNIVAANPTAKIARILDANQANSVFDYNCYWERGGALTFRSTSDKTQAEWLALGYDEHTIVADPHLVTESAGNYHLAGASPCIGGATPNTILSDLDGNGRPRYGAGCIGAYEYVEEYP